MCADLVAVPSRHVDTRLMSNGVEPLTSLGAAADRSQTPSQPMLAVALSVLPRQSRLGKWGRMCLFIVCEQLNQIKNLI